MVRVEERDGLGIGGVLHRHHALSESSEPTKVFVRGAKIYTIDRIPESESELNMAGSYPLYQLPINRQASI